MAHGHPIAYSCRDTDRVSANVLPIDREPAKIESNCRRLLRGQRDDCPARHAGSGHRIV